MGDGSNDGAGGGGNSGGCCVYSRRDRSCVVHDDRHGEVLCMEPTSDMSDGGTLPAAESACEYSDSVDGDV
jgi:hypothetical protein